MGVEWVKSNKLEEISKSAVVLLTIALIVLAFPAKAENVLRWASQGDGLTFDIHSQNEGPTLTIQRQVYEPLVGRDKDMGLEPALALSWAATSQTIWEFKIRQGVLFHDGTVMTIEDVVFSLERARSETSDFRTSLISIVVVRAIDATTLEIETDGPNPILPNEITDVAIMSKAWAVANDVEAPADFAAGEENFAVRNANGTGPFKLELREPDIRTIMLRNEDWWGLEKDPHNIDKIIFTPISNAATRVAALLSGELDILLDPPLQDLRRIESTPGLKVARTAQTRTIFFGLDQSVDELRSSNVKGKNPFRDKRVRQAMYQAININAIQKKIMRGLSQPAGIITAPGVHGYSDDLNSRLAYDPEAAKALLVEAGYPDGFEVKLDCPNDRYINDEAICQATVGMLAKIGIKVSLDAQPKSLHFPKLENRKSDFYMLGWGVTTMDSHYVFSFLLHEAGSWNVIGYSNEELNQLVEQIGREINQATRDEMIAKTWAITKEDIPYLPLHHQMLAWGLSENIDMPIVVTNIPEFRMARMKSQ